MSVMMALLGSSPNQEITRLIQASRLDLEKAVPGPLWASASNFVDRILAIQIENERLAKSKSIAGMCQRICMLIADDKISIRLMEMRQLDARMHGETPDATIESYDHARHFEMIRCWGSTPEVGLLGSGLLVPYVACMFSGVIGGTRMLYVYGAMTNPVAPAQSRAKALIRLSSETMAAAKAAEMDYLMANTDNDVVSRYLTEKLGAVELSGKLFEARL